MPSWTISTSVGRVGSASRTVQRPSVSRSTGGISADSASSWKTYRLCFAAPEPGGYEELSADVLRNRGVTTPLLLVDAADGIATVVLNRPEARNALNRDLRRVLWDTMLDLGEDPDVGV